VAHDKARSEHQHTSLHRSPFWILDLSPRDNRSLIMQVAEEAALELDAEQCEAAKSQLTNLPKRLAAEVAWLPGISPNRAKNLALQILLSPHTVLLEGALPPLVRANLAAALYESSDTAPPLVDFFVTLAEVQADEVLKFINEDRSVAGFPLVPSLTNVEEALASHTRYFASSVVAWLDRLPSRSISSVLSSTIEELSIYFDSLPDTLSDIIDSYETRSSSFLELESANVEKLLAAARKLAPIGSDALQPILLKIQEVARNWDHIAQPIQLLAQAKGIEHKPSRNLAMSIRNLAIELVNDHALVDEAASLTELLKELFAELPILSERLEADAADLDELRKEIGKAKESREEWERALSFSCEIGSVFRSRLAMSAKGIEWKGQLIPFDDISQVRWGGTKKYVNGIPMGTTYTINYVAPRSHTTIELKDGHQFGEITERLWKAVGVRMLVRFAEEMRSGKPLQFGRAIIEDDGVVLNKQSFFGGGDPTKVPWKDVVVSSGSGFFYLASRTEKKRHESLSYLDDANVHIVEQLIRIAMRQQGMMRLSDILKG
jgi:hypothetical protein